MKLTKVVSSWQLEEGGARLCHTDDCCATIYETDRGTYLVQGYTLKDQESVRALGLPPDEDVVEVPREVLHEFAARNGGE